MSGCVPQTQFDVCIVDEDVVNVVFEDSRFAGLPISMLLKSIHAEPTHYTVGKYPRVKTLRRDVLPHAPSPLPRCQSRAERARIRTYSSTSFRCTVFEPPQSGILLVLTRCRAGRCSGFDGDQREERRVSRSARRSRWTHSDVSQRLYALPG